MEFKIKVKIKPAGDQPKAIKKLVNGLKKGHKFQTLLGVTGSGKTFSIANVIEKIQKPTLVIAPNKTLAAQLTTEFRQLFPDNEACYFVSYYDYYQPEAYLAPTDTYIEKEAEINEEIDRLRHLATSALLTRKDVIICASVSCIYGLGNPNFYQEISIHLEPGQIITRETLLRELVRLKYTRSKILSRGKFLARGEVVEVMPPGEDMIYRIEMSGDKISKVFAIDPLIKKRKKVLRVDIFPTKHFVTPEPVLTEAIGQIKKELVERLGFFKKKNLFLEAERLERRTLYDLEMLKELGYCAGIENYSRYLSGRAPGQPPYTLIDYFPRDFLLVIDESHVTVPQLRGMYEGDRSRKETLVAHGFRLPSALDNRPLKFNEFEARINQAIFTSATPAGYERKKSAQVVEQIIRPTGLVDPKIIVQPAENQIDDLIIKLKKVIKARGRALVTTLRKKTAEDLSEYLREKGFKTDYLHSEVATLDRVVVLENLRRGKIDILVGVNLLREGLDLPEVELVAILDADKEGFLRSETSLIQTMGRAARNVRGRVILYADEITGSMSRAIKETNRRRRIQAAYNRKHKITPKSISKKIVKFFEEIERPEPVKEYEKALDIKDIPKILEEKTREMKELAKNLEFEKAALIRDEIKQLKKLILKT